MAVGIREADRFDRGIRVMKCAAVAISHPFRRCKLLQFIQLGFRRQIDPEEKSTARARPRAKVIDVFVKRFDDSTAFRADSGVRLDEVRLQMLHEEFCDDGTRERACAAIPPILVDLSPIGFACDEIALPHACT